VKPEERDTRAPASGLAVLRDANFWPYFVGNLLSNCGTWFQNLAQALLVYRLTGSILLVGVVNFAQFVGTFLLAPWAGAAADRYDRRRLLLVTQVVAVAVTTVLALVAAADAATAPVVIGLALVLGVTTAFGAPAMLALVPLLVPPHELPGAVALNSVTFNLARVIGPVLGAVVIAQLGIPAAFGLNAVSYLALIAALLVVRPRPQAPAPKRRPRLRESLVLVAGDPHLRLMFLAIVSLSITADVVNTLGPGFATEIYGYADTVAGVLIGAFGAGAVTAVFVVTRRRGDPHRRIARTLAALGAGTVAFGLAPGLLLALPALALAGFGYLAANTTATTAIQLEVDDAQLGRVMALWSVAFLGVRPFASLVDGALATTLGLRAAAVLMAVPALAGAAVFAAARRAGPETAS
jgi:predicted MFS family arabinose efflux permease